MPPTNSVAVLCGGWTEEREISLQSGLRVLEALRENQTPCVGLDLVRSGSEVSQDQLEPVAIEKLISKLRQLGSELVFVVLHGRLGEDGTLQGLLEMAEIPYTGSGVMASAMALDKIMAKQMFIWNNVETPDFQMWKRGDPVEGTTQYPVVVKPVTCGSSVGITRVAQGKDLLAALETALAHDTRVLIEAQITGRELTVALLDGHAFPPLEIFPPDGFYDFKAKYTEACRHEVLQSQEELVLRLQESALRAFQSLQCRGLARADFMLDTNNRLWCLEVNTIPGLTETSLAPDAAAAEGMDFSELVGKMMASARSL